MYKSLTVEKIMQRSDSESLGNLETLTMFYDPVMDEVVLNSSHEHYNICQMLIERYLIADESHREKAKDKLKIFKEEIALLDEVIEIRQKISESYSEKLKKRYVKEFKMIGSNNAFWSNMEMLRAIDTVADPFWKPINAFTWGYIQGKRAERARRKKVQP